jgi:hypothetical protein
MSKSEVREILGEPDKVVEFPGGSTFWHYGYPAGGHVQFDESTKTSAWTEP